MSWTDWLPVTRRQLRETMEVVMAENTAAFAELDAQLDALEAYVLSDDATDAAQVRTRVDRVRNLLATVNPEVETPVAE